MKRMTRINRLILFTTLFLCLDFAGRAQSIIIGEGTETGVPPSQNNEVSGPIYRSSAASGIDNSRHHYLYTQAELLAAGLPAGAIITSLAWYKDNEAATTGDAIMKIYMKNSSLTTIQTLPQAWADLIQGSTLVYNTTTQTIPATVGYIEFSLNNSMAYTGVGLEISVDWDISGVAGNPTTDGFSWLKDPIANRTIGKASNLSVDPSLLDSIGSTIDSQGNPANNSVFNRTVRPQLKITYIPSVKVSLKAYLQGAYNNTAGRHKDVTTTWANVLNANALTQPFNVAPFNYTGTEQVSTGFFTSNSGATTDITDWVLIELRDGSNPATLISRKAAFIREDGQIVATDGGPVTLTAPAGDGNYYITVRHRNHLAVRSANPIALNGNTTTVYDFTSAQSQAYQNPSVPGNTAMATKDLPGTETGKFLLWGGNANGDGFIRASGASNVSDYLTLLGPLCLQGDFSKILNSVYRKEDMNLDGVVRASAALNVNDYITLLSTGILGGNTSNIIAAH